MSQAVFVDASAWVPLPIGRIEITVVKNGKPVAALVALRNADVETVSLSTNKEFLAIIERSRSRLKREGGISSNEIRRRLKIEK